MINYVAFGHFLDNPKEYCVWFCGNIKGGIKIGSFVDYNNANQFMLNNGWQLAHKDNDENFRVDYWVIPIGDYKNEK